jgi:hypothetical protein
MLTPTERRTLTRTVVKSMRAHQVWMTPELRDRPDALRERDEALHQARKALVALINDHTEEVKARLRARPQEGDRDDHRAASA